VMFEIPSRGDVKKVVIDGETITHRKPASLLTRSETQPRGIELEDASA
jgi:ATP-dependent protease Clp ATPase subunit